MTIEIGNGLEFIMDIDFSFVKGSFD